jgi:NADPH:quinone reductase
LTWATVWGAADAGEDPVAAVPAIVAGCQAGRRGVRGPEVLHIGEVETPVPGPRQVLIKTCYAGINFADIGRRTGLYGVPSLPFVPGLEGSGTVECVGEDVTGIEPGTKVIGYRVTTGSYAEYFVTDAEKVAAVSANVKHEEAAGIPPIFMTSWNAVVHRAKLQPGESILVQSAGNGAGIAAVEIARHIGARVIGTASNAAKLEAAKQAGADNVINYLEDDFEAEVARLTEGRGVDVVLDGVGGETFTKGVRSLAANGRILSLGFSGGDSTLSFHAFDLGRGSVIMSGSAGLGDLARAEFERVLDLFEQGVFKPVPTTVFPWTEAGAAHQLLEDRSSRPRRKR